MNPDTHLLGIRFWAQWRPLGVTPAYEVYVYSGSIASLGIHVFRSYTNHQRVINKTLDQLNINGFRPFCLDMRAIRDNADLRGITVS